MEIRACPSRNIHAKLYIMTFKEGDRDTGRVITGSSNFTQAGLVDNLEFNVELKNRSDYYFVRNKFEELWCNAVAVNDRYVDTIRKKTWLSRNITPYQLYLKFLYEYFKGELNQTDDVFVRFLPPEFKKLEYQKQAVLNAKKIVLEYGGVRTSQLRMPFLIDIDWFRAFKLLYENAKTKSRTYSLINNLIREGGSTFRKLKEIL